MEFALITERLRQQFLEEGDSFQIASLLYLAKVSEATHYVDSLQPDGAWPDVDYADSTSSANTAEWAPYRALYRMVAMAEAYRDPSNAAYQDLRIIDALNRALLHWDRENPQSSNWWENEIGKSMAFGRLAIFVGNELSPAALAVAFTHNVGVVDGVGANGAWRTANVLLKAVAKGDPIQMAKGLNGLKMTVGLDDSGDVNEAVQPDGSFWAHGRLLYNEWYGMSLFQTVAAWADAVRETRYSFSPDDLAAVSHFILDGTRWMIRGNFGLMVTLYKEPMSFRGVSSAASAFLLPLERMSRADAANSSEYERLAENITGASPQNGVTGDKYFWRGEFSSHITNDYSIMTRLNSSRSTGGEYRSIYRPDVGNEMWWNASGATAIHVSNEEYVALGPAFDWLHYPGTTAPNEKNPEATATNDGSFTGGVSNGSNSVSVQSLSQKDTNASKSYFQFDTVMVALGAGVSSTENVEVHTTVNQSIASPNASVNGRQLELGSSGPVDNVRWAYNGEVGYVFPQPGGASLSAAHRSQSGSYGVNKQIETRNAYVLYFNHGLLPENAEYSYIVVPAQSPAFVEEYSRCPGVTILENSPRLQAVSDANAQLTMAVFFEPGTAVLIDGSTLTVDASSLVILDQSGPVPEITVSSPDQEGIDVLVSFGATEFVASATVRLGSGPDAFRSVTQPLNVSLPTHSP